MLLQMKVCVPCVCTQGTELIHDMAVSAACCLCFRELRKFDLFKLTLIEIYTNTTQRCIAASTWVLGAAEGEPVT